VASSIAGGGDIPPSGAVNLVATVNRFLVDRGILPGAKNPRTEKHCPWLPARERHGFSVIEWTLYA